MTGKPLARAASSSGLPDFTALEMTTERAPTRLTGSCPMNTRTPFARKRRTFALSFWSLPWTE